MAITKVRWHAITKCNSGLNTECFSDKIQWKSYFQFVDYDNRITLNNKIITKFDEKTKIEDVFSFCEDHFNDLKNKKEC